MTPEQITTIIAALLQGGGVSYVVLQIVRGLRERVSGLEQKIQVQSGTLDAMDRQIQETQKITGIYKTLLHDFPDDIKQYKTIVTETKDSVIIELKRQNEEKDSRLKQLEEQLEQSSDNSAFPDMARRRIAVQSFLLQEQNRDFCEFAKNVYQDILLVIIALETVNTFEQLMEDRRIQFETVSGINEIQNLIASQQEAGRPHMIFASFGIDGGYGLRSDSVLLITPMRLERYRDALRILQSVKTSA